MTASFISDHPFLERTGSTDPDPSLCSEPFCCQHDALIQPTTPSLGRICDRDACFELNPGAKLTTADHQANTFSQHNSPPRHRHRCLNLYHVRVLAQFPRLQTLARQESTDADKMPELQTSTSRKNLQRPTSPRERHPPIHTAARPMPLNPSQSGVGLSPTVQSAAPPTPSSSRRPAIRRAASQSIRR